MILSHQAIVNMSVVFRATLRNRDRAQQVYTGMGIIGPWAREFLCPVCRRVANVLLPIVHDEQTPIDPSSQASAQSASAAEQEAETPPEQHAEGADAWDLGRLVRQAEGVLRRSGASSQAPAEGGRPGELAQIAKLVKLLAACTATLSSPT